jgi:hypothetical protein
MQYSIDRTFSATSAPLSSNISQSYVEAYNASMVSTLSKAIAVVVTIFATPAILAGLLMGVFFLKSYATLTAAGAAAFGGIALALVIVPALAIGRAWSGVFANDRYESLLAQRSPELWRSNRLWASGRIPASAAASSLIGEWLFGLVFTVAGLLLLYAMTLSDGPNMWVGYVVATSFAVAGVWLLVVTIRKTVATRRYRSVLVLETVPAPIGGALRAHIEIHTDAGRFDAARAIELRLSCLRRRHVKGRTEDIVVWQDSTEVAPSALLRRPGGVKLPIEFGIPADAEPSGMLKLTGRVVWRVEVIADVPGVDYIAQFEVPVFPTREPVVPPTPRPIAARPVRSTIPVHETNGTLRFDFPAFSNVSFGVFMFFLSLVWFAACFLTIDAHSILGTAALSIAGVFCFYIALQSVFGSSSVVVRNDRIDVTRRLIVERRRVLPKAIVRDVIVNLTSTSRTGSGPTTSWYSVVALTKNGKRVVLGKGLKDKHEAASLANRVLSRLGLPLHDEDSAAGTPSLAQLLP